MRTKKRKPANRHKQPTNITLDPVIKKLAQEIAEEEGTNLSQLATQLLLERLKASGRWPLSRATERGA